MTALLPDVDLQALHVVVPARDEAARLPAMLASLRVALDAVRRHRPSLQLGVTVVLDSCTDASAEVVAAYPWVDALPVSLGVVGRVRAAGIAHARGATDPDRTWIASTDADSQVPPDWLLQQVRRAEEGHGLVVGTVHPDPGELEPGLLAQWRARHSTADGHSHVHGANLGFTLAAYDLVGGFPSLAVHEDVALVTRMRDHGVRSCSTGRGAVLTSGRLAGRTPAGFAAYLATLGA